MNSPSKTFKRLGIVGAAAVVGLVPIGVLSTSAYAVSSPSLLLASTVPNQTTNATNSFTVSNSSSAGSTETLTIQSNGEALPTNIADYTVTVGGANDTATADTAANTGLTASAAYLNLATAPTAGQAVVVTINGVVNPASGGVSFVDQASSDANMPPLTTNVETISSTSSAVATVASVNPQAFPGSSANPSTAAAEEFTVMGTSLVTGTGNSVLACFVPIGTATTIPTGGTTTAPCTLTAATAATSIVAATGASITSTEYQGSVAGLWAGTQYDVVLYNASTTTPPGGAATTTYASASATSTNTVVAAAVTTSPDGGALNFVPETGVRAVDSRLGLGLPANALTPGVAYPIPVTAFENQTSVPTNVPTGAAAVALNVTAVAPSEPGNLQVWESTTGSCVANSDLQSTVNFQQPQDTNNSTLVGLNGGGPVCVQDNGASVNVVMDVTGYATADYTPSSYGAGTRLLDTRPGAPSSENLVQGPLAGGTVYRLNTNEAAGTVVALNVTAVGPTAAGNLRIFPEPTSGAPAPSAVPNTAVATYIPGVDGGSFTITSVGNGGYIDLYSDTSGSVNVVIDQVGKFSTGSSVNAIVPTRMVDTRPGGVAAGGMTSFTAAPFATLPNNVPGTALGVVGSLADIQPSSPGYLVAYPGGETMPGTANIANFPGQTRSTTAFAAVNPANGMVTVSSVGATTNFTFDATAYIQ